jgi:hypothetical protein
MGVTAADFDLDGYPDIFVANDKTENFLFHNEKDGTFREIGLPAGVAYGQAGENTSAMGPVFEDFEHDGQQRERVAGSGYLSQDDPRVHFGLGSSAKIERLTVTWPGGTRQVIENPPANRVVVVEEK